MKKILYAGAEVMPFAATGGLGDVLGSLPAAVREASDRNVDVRVVMPLYKCIKDLWREKMTDEGVIYVDLSWRHQYCGIKSLEKDGVTFYFIDNEYYFGRDKLYGYRDDGERFAFFSKAILDLMSAIEFYPDIFNANDWSTALSVVYLEKIYKKRKAYENIRSVFTIHNIEYQGRFGYEMISDVIGLPDRDIFEHDGCVNLMKGAIECADKISTVSPTYAIEILGERYSCGLHRCLAEHRHKLTGILNGIDYDYYDPSRDPSLAVTYDQSSVELKAENKAALQRELELPERDVPMLAVVSRLASHKGIELIKGMISEVLLENSVQLVVLGTGEERYERFFRELESAHPDKCRALITYDRDLAKRIYASSDIFLMPSESEPCGLSQMIASRYGAIPIVRETGGLRDSIKGFFEDESGELYGNGFTFADHSAETLRHRVGAAIALCNDRDKRIAFASRIMRTDFSWSVSARKYLQMYFA